MSHHIKNFSAFLYSDYPSDALHIETIREHLKKIGIKSEYLGNYYKYLGISEDEVSVLSVKLSSIHISDTEKENEYFVPDDIRIKRETDIIKNRKSPDTKILYEGRLLGSMLFLPLIRKNPEIVKSNDLHIVYTSRLFCTFGDKRYHARVVLTGIPCLISTSGLVEAPARPKEYYWLKASFIQGGRDIEELNDMFRDRFVDYDDPKITDILYSYTLQVIFHFLTGESFCLDKNCCLYNSHWQEEVLSAQLRGDLCNNHKRIIKEYSSF